IGKMLIAGIMPGLILAALYILYILYVAYFRPGQVPPPSGERIPLAAKLRSLRAVILPMLLIMMILGSIFFGIATPTEAAAVGVLGAILASAVRRRLTARGLGAAAIETLKATAMILWITIGAKAYVAIFTGLGGANTLMEFIRHLDMPPYAVLAAMMLILIFLGTALDEIGIILLTVPVFLPIVRLMGFDEIWFGVLYAITIQTGYISPPFGYTLFYIKGPLPPHLGMGTVYRGVTPFMLLQIVALLICAAFPGLITWLPRLMAH
ncbi:MAG TPA: TRAP transporter large permease subunit, partial [Bordetella sp.]|nr:TRAP transporter large permease subunit [Bordetella sp.]